ncbi:hypothetical protein CAC42_6904 [Sphaceloma murrayae]|uniref:HRDC domain-containing protein n=1 Tax=Sphaceloma murrayae TaxID=2082308 RepID=A0A2K1QQC0_9PEZI|nr:hypothetical protein CAC42_6904 [Sphaceloma murrayae]
MAATTDSTTFLGPISSGLLAVTRTANSLATEDLDFHRNLDPSIGTRIDKQNARLLRLAERLLENAASSSEVVRPRLPDADAVDENWRGIVDVLDSLLEKADTSLDEFSGAVKRLSPSREQVMDTKPMHEHFADADKTPTSVPKPSRISQALRSQEIYKPQLDFFTVPSNDDIAPFRPLLKSKPHAKIPLEESAAQYEGEDGLQHTSHPYQSEIEAYEYPTFVYTRAEPIMYEPFESTTATLVDTEEAMMEMLDELKQAKEIAVDLEHHDYRSYIGLVSLMQISTRNRDWIVDTLKPWRRKLQILNEVFADPSILKVLHGAHMDTIWLQRDLGLYLVGLFDTHCASRVLGYPGGSLAFLLKKFINFDAQKQYQTADWRVRPLPTELFDYARSDTHFLLYIYDNMRNELLDRSALSDPEQDKVQAVLQRSKDVALQTYNHPMYDANRGLGPAGWYRMLSRTPTLLNKEQFAVFRAIHHWRDRVAREQDDSVHYVLANHNLFSIAKEMPVERAKLFSVAQPVTQTLRLRADEVIAAIKLAKDQAPGEAEMKDVLRDIETFLYGEPMIDTRPAAPEPSEVRVKGPSKINRAEEPAILVTRPSTPPTALSTLRSSLSTFWGSAFPSRNRKLSSLAPRMDIPIPPLTAEIFVSNAAAALTPTRTVTASTALTPASSGANTPQSDSKEIFTLRAKGRGEKRKRATDAPGAATPTTSYGIDDGLAGNEDEISITPNSREQTKEAKRRRREEKKTRSAGHNDYVKSVLADLDDGDDVDEPGRRDGDGAQAHDMDVEDGAFDYSTAKSVLHANAEREREEKRKGKEGKKGVGKGKAEKKEPFTMAKGLGDVKRGLGRRQKDGGGRSLTFK